MVLAEPISYNLREAKCYLGGPIANMQYQTTEYSSIENVGEFNGYEWCRYEGDCLYTWADDTIKFKIVGYTTFLKNTGNPIYVSAMDAREDQSQVDAESLHPLLHFLLERYTPSLPAMLPPAP